MMMDNVDITNNPSVTSVTSRKDTTMNIHVAEVISAIDNDSVPSNPKIEADLLKEAREATEASPIEKETVEKTIRESPRAVSNAAKNPKFKLRKTKKVGFEAMDEKRKDINGFLRTKTGQKLKIYRKAFLSTYGSLLALGATEQSIARILGLGETAFAFSKYDGDARVKKTYEQVMAELEPALMCNLLKQALGYDYEEIKETYEPKKDAKNEDDFQKVKIEKTIKHQHGSAELFIFYLTNKYPDKWRLKRADVAGNQLHFHITGKIESERLRKLAGKYLPEIVMLPEPENEIVETNSDAE